MSRPVQTTATTVPNTSQDPTMANNLPSPTLTNPDMILPYEGERESSTPSPPFDAVRRLHEDINQTGFQLSPPQYAGHHNYQQLQESNPCNNHSNDNYNATTKSTGSESISLATSLEQENQRSSPRGHWYDHPDIAAPLSDIGEETEDEDDYRRSRAYRLSQDTMRAHDAATQGIRPIGASPQWQPKGEVESCDADSCSGSSSTVSAGGERFTPRPHGVESRDSSREHTTEPQTCDNQDNQDENHKSEVGYEDQYARRSFESERHRMSSIEEEEEIPSDDDDIKEAEKILENAKKRLTHMEGNLTRARSSLRMTPSPAPSSNHSPTPGHQPFGYHSRSQSKGERRAQTSLAGALLRQKAWQEMNSQQPSHSRRLSEIYVPSFQKTRQHPESEQRVRSASALASTNPYAFATRDHSSPKDSYFGSTLPNQSSGPHYNYAPPSPGKDSISPSDSASIPQTSPSARSGARDTKEILKISSMEEFNAAYPASPPSRTHSQLQARGLQGQMHDLKSKISDLKEKAQEDNLRRRSLQSLRTPSPFTAAEQWYATALDYGETGQKRESIIVPSHSDAKREDESVGNKDGGASTSRTGGSPVRGKHGELLGNPPSMSPRPYSAAETEDHFEDAIDYEGSDGSSGSEIDREALEEILNEPLDSPDPLDQELLEEFPLVPANSESLRHEDRVDAFDYEHFYLHSVLGNYSGGAPRRDSSSSSSSAETTRPSSQGAQYESTVGPGKHKRTNSGDSISTAATFATATEGAYSSEDEGSADGEIDKALQWDRNLATPTGPGNEDNLNHQQQYPHDQDGALESTPTNARHRSTKSNGHSVDPPTYTVLHAESSPSTPRASQNHSHHKRDNPKQSSKSLSPPDLTPAASSPSDLISSLISISNASSAPSQRSFATPQLSTEDTALIEPLLLKLGRTCSSLLPSSSPDTVDENGIVRLRQRLELATRALDGELDA